MRLSFESLSTGIAIFLLATISVFLSTLDIPEAALVVNAIASVLLIVQARALTGHYTSLLLVFLVASTLYGLSGPFSVVFGDGLSPRFPTPYLVNEFNKHYAIAMFGLSVGVLIHPSIFPPNRRRIGPRRRQSPRVMLFLGNLLAIFSSLAELINVVRAGGFSLLLAGKAVYQSTVSDLVGTLPSFNLLLIAVILFGVGLGLEMRRHIHLRRMGGRLVTFLLLASPLLSNYAILGRRGPLLSLVLVFLLALLFYAPIRRVQYKWVPIALVVYLGFGLMYASRSYIGPAIATGDLSILTTRLSNGQTWVRALNPGSNEFGAPFGNFNAYLLSEPQELRYGQTYLVGLTAWVPRFMWPDKPESVIYEFRDQFFPETAKRGSIGGTAYSSILEAYVNFGTLGVLYVYLLIGWLLGWLEVRRSQRPSMYFVMIYLSLVPMAVTFHRSDFKMPAVLLLMVVSVAACLQILTYSKSSPNRRVSVLSGEGASNG